ncbi:hypothetical protein C3F09_00305 [candidate division GN15 bacterium]|uniref:Peptidase S74 domain-containing protein n=1 Tax=candidate division GN15 bacterium TaxID=2072418 RepID=A0A855X747_9BACT|nr:MAG: hypothetical protein C3F09_00305 [candidate division GN15 bacterium]
MRLIVCISLVVLASVVISEPLLINYQGRLTDASGNAVPDANYMLAFGLFRDSTGGTALWTEVHSAVHTSGGMFTVRLGSVNPYNLDLFDSGALFLQVQIGTEAPVIPRTRLTTAPVSAVARRLYGDIQTGDGFLNVAKGGTKMIELTSGTGAASRASMVMFNPQPEPPGSDPLIQMSADVGGTAGLWLYNPMLTVPFDEKVFEVTNNPTGGASMVMFNPQPEPPGSDPLIQMKTGADGSAGLRLFNPMTATPYDQKVFELVNNSSGGAAMHFLSNGTEFMGVDPSPWHPGGDLTMRDAAGSQTIILSSAGSLSIGTSSTANILTVRQYSSTDPIADAWTTYSSRRWKTNIETINDPLSKVVALRGVTFDWKETGKHDFGLIAEEVAEVVPEVVAYDDNGIDAKSVDYARLTALLIEAVKEQQKTIADMKSEIDKLKAHPVGQPAATAQQ